jgi:hypothetical protein
MLPFDPAAEDDPTIQNLIESYPDLGGGGLAGAMATQIPGSQPIPTQGGFPDLSALAGGAAPGSGGLPPGLLPPQSSQRPLTAEDLIGPQKAPSQLPLPPDYAMSVNDLPPELQQQYRQQMLSQMGVAFGNARSGTLGSAIAAASGVPGQEQQQAVHNYQQLQDLQYRRALAVAEQQQKMEQQTAAQARLTQQATQGANAVNAIEQAFPGSSLGQDARRLAMSGDYAALDKMLTNVPSFKAAQAAGVDPSDQQAYQDYLDSRKADAAALAAGKKTDAERAAALPYETFIKQLDNGIVTARETGQKQLENSLVTARETAQKQLEDTLIRGRESDKQSTGATPLTQTAAAELSSKQVKDAYEAYVTRWKTDSNFQQSEIAAGKNPETKLVDLKAAMYGAPPPGGAAGPPIPGSGPLLPAGVSIAAPRTAPSPVTTSPLLPRATPPTVGAEVRTGGTGLAPGQKLPTPPAATVTSWKAYADKAGGGAVGDGAVRAAIKDPIQAAAIIAAIHQGE